VSFPTHKTLLPKLLQKLINKKLCLDVSHLNVFKHICHMGLEQNEEDDGIQNFGLICSSKLNLINYLESYRKALLELSCSDVSV